MHSLSYEIRLNFQSVIDFLESSSQLDVYGNTNTIKQIAKIPTKLNSNLTWQIIYNANK